MGLKKETGDKLFSLILLLPAVITTILFIVVPILDSVYRSFLDFKIKNIISGTAGTWNSFQNYTRLIQSGKLGRAIAVNLIFVVAVVVLQFIFGMSLALILNQKIRGSRFFRSIMMIPWVVPTVISGLVWMWFYQPQYGLLKYLVSFFSGGRVTEFAILNDPKTAIIGIMIAALWKQVPLGALLLLAGLSNVPMDMQEAAAIDGANYWQKLIRVVIPSMLPVIKVTLTMSIIENFKQFPLFWTMTGGGPNGATTTLAVLSYREAFVSNNLGSGAAVTTLWMVLMIMVVFLFNKALRTER
ncbi:sugar ABC transporter permease [Clostridiales bacterium COT073_COT-073]|nr:sugar ABC transporter permease [Clostridiales bacterium COT073_COT-073]